MRNEIPCPICSADIPLAGDERAGDEIYCGYCGSPSKLTRELDDPECSADEEF